MADEPEKVKIELEVPKDQVNIEAVQEEDKSGGEEAKSENGKERKEASGTASGYEPGEILKAPVEAPHITSARNPNYTQRVVVVIGFAMAVAGLLIWPLVSLAAGLAVAVAGALLVALGTMFRL